MAPDREPRPTSHPASGRRLREAPCRGSGGQKRIGSCGILRLCKTTCNPKLGITGEHRAWSATRSAVLVRAVPTTLLHQDGRQLFRYALFT